MEKVIGNVTLITGTEDVNGKSCLFVEYRAKSLQTSNVIVIHFGHEDVLEMGQFHITRDQVSYCGDTLNPGTTNLEKMWERATGESLDAVNSEIDKEAKEILHRETV